MLIYMLRIAPHLSMAQHHENQMRLQRQREAQAQAQAQAQQAQGNRPEDMQHGSGNW